MAVEAGDIVLVRSDPRDVPAIIELSKASYAKMIQNSGGPPGNIVAIRWLPASWPVRSVLHPAVGSIDVCQHDSRGDQCPASGACDYGERR